MSENLNPCPPRGRFNRRYAVPQCTCYVKDLSPEQRFIIRYGAHDTACPVYHPSLDPVDAKQDENIRATYTLTRQDPTFSLVDDGTLDTLVKCDTCGQEMRYWADPTDKPDERIAATIKDAQETHECNGKP